MIRVALVGNIASGKSSAKQIVEKLGYDIVDTDKICHNLINELKTTIQEAFSDCDISENNEISREKLGKIVFNDNNLKTKLENILYPKLINKINEFFNNNLEKEMVFVEIPLLYEANMEYLFDKVVFVYCEDEIRLKRLINRNNYTQEYAQKRLDSQINQEEKLNRADYVIYNNSDFENLEVQIKHSIEQIRSNRDR